MWMAQFHFLFGKNKKNTPGQREHHKQDTVMLQASGKSAGRL
jgi:hypothetical protein